MRPRLSPLIIATIFGASVAYALIALSPNSYTARAAVLPPSEAAPSSRLLRLHATEAGVAAAALGALAGFALGAAFVVARERRRRPVRSEEDFRRALGEPLLAARPLREESLDPLCRQLLEHWFTPQRRLLPVVSAEPGEGRSRLAAALAARFAALGEKVLLVDADFRSPSLHRRLRLPNRAGLADFLEGRGTGVAMCGSNLGVIVAGRCRCDPIEALASPRLPALLREAGRHFRVVLIDTPAAACGPDLQMPAALAGGALVVARPGAGRASALEGLRALLQHGSARVVATLIRRG